MERDSCICRYEIDSDELRSCTVVVLHNILELAGKFL